MASYHSVSDSDSDVTIEPDEEDLEYFKPDQRTTCESPDLFADDDKATTSVLKRKRTKLHEISDSSSDTDEGANSKDVSQNNATSKSKVRNLSKHGSSEKKNGKKNSHSPLHSKVKKRLTETSCDKIKAEPSGNKISEYKISRKTHTPESLSEKFPLDLTEETRMKRSSSGSPFRPGSESKWSPSTSSHGSSLKRSSSGLSDRPDLKKSDTVICTDDGENNSVEMKKKPPCRYGSKCYRKNPSHLEEFSHPGDEKPSTSKEKDEPPIKRMKTSPSQTSTMPSGSGKDSSHFSFYLTKVTGIAGKYNAHARDIKDILSTSMGNLVASCHFNYMFEIDWLMKQYPANFRSKPVLLVHGEQGPSKTRLQAEAHDYSNISFCQAKLEMLYGTHHTKMMLLLYDNGMRVVIHTANLIQRDWYQKTQGIWISPLFPKLPKVCKTDGDSPTHFKRDLIEYISSYKAYQLTVWTNHIAAHDMSEARVFIIGSVPGRHVGEKAKSMWGHTRLRKVLQEHGPNPGDVKSWPVIGQFSSIGSMGPSKENWLCGEFQQSLTASRGTMLSSSSKLQLVFPTKDNVRLSLEGFPAGGSIPYSINVAKKQQYLHTFFHQWKSEGQGRSRAMPHIKTYLRPSPDYKQAAWFLVTSSNLSKAAWGAHEKKGTQLMIRSYELGVLFIPKFFGCENTFRISSHTEDVGQKTFLLPYDLPPTDYGKGDRPWMWDIPYMDLPDTNGNIWCPGSS